MQKISGILGASSRVTSVDMKEAPPVRPGTPGFGRPEGVSSLRQRASAVDALTTAPELLGRQMEIRSKEALQAKAAANISNSFFMKNNRDVAPPAAAEGDQMVDVMIAIPVQVPVSELEPLASKPAQADYDSIAAEAKEATAPEGLFPRGSFVDVVA